MRINKMMTNKKAAISSIFQGYDIKIRRTISGKMDWDVVSRGGDVYNCKTKVEAEKVLNNLITCFEENENQYL